MFEIDRPVKIPESASLLVELTVCEDYAVKEQR